jgi:hypothetical protein
MSTIAGIVIASRALHGRVPAEWTQSRDVRLTRISCFQPEEARAVPDVVLLTLADAAECEQPRVPVLACADALRSGGASVDLATARADSEVDTALKPVEAGDARLVVAAATDAQIRAVVRRMVRHHAPPPSKRPAELPAGRTVFDLPPLAVLPLAPAVPDLVTELGLPRRPDEVAAATLAGTARRLDLLRTDAGSVTLHGCLFGGVDGSGAAVPWRARIEVDDAVLGDGREALLACSVRNTGASEVDGLPLVAAAGPDDGAVHVAVAVPLVRSRRLRRPAVAFEVRRARGRAVTVRPREAVHLVDDGVAGVLDRARAWWVEAGCWAAYVGPPT